MYYYIDKEEIFVDDINTETDWPNIRLQFNFYLDRKLVN